MAAIPLASDRGRDAAEVETAVGCTMQEVHGRWRITPCGA